MPVSTDLRDTVLARQREGATITQIAQELGVSRPTIYKALTVLDDWETYFKDKSNSINRLALKAVERACQRGDARIGLQWLEHTVLAADQSAVYHIHGDATIQTAIGMLPGPASQPSTTSTAMSTESSVSSGTEAAAKPPGSDSGLSVQANFSPNLASCSLAELEAEVARRKSLLIEVEVVGG